MTYCCDVHTELKGINGKECVSVPFQLEQHWCDYEMLFHLLTQLELLKGYSSTHIHTHIYLGKYLYIISKDQIFKMQIIYLIKFYIEHFCECLWF